MAEGSFRVKREALMSDPGLAGETFCLAFSDLTDEWLRSIADNATSGASRKLALIAVGGYGRRELCPYSDLDLVLVHDGRRDIKAVADALWYPVWDEGIKVDHAVRRPKEVLKAASSDLRVALGFLDARVIWGDAKFAEPIIEKVRSLWMTRLANDFIPALEDQMRERHRLEGDVAFLLEPNLKEAHGGLRDVSVLRALTTCAPRLGELVDLDVLNTGASTLTSVRVGLHRIAGRALDRMLLQEQDALASTLNFTDADDLCRAVSEAGRSIALLSDEMWRRRTLWAPGQRSPVAVESNRIDVEDGVVIHNEEVALAPSADVSGDSSLIWRVAAVAAERDLPISLGAVHRLADRTPPAPDPWPPLVRDSLVRLLLTGHRAIPAFEAIDQMGLVSHLIPEWEHVRHHHQRNAYHRFTVDRHLLEAAANASDLAETTDRPDLLVIGALFHDIGKGLPGDHTEVGIEIMGHLGPRMGFPPEDVQILQDLVRLHLLLADTATRRDLSDPVTLETVAQAVGNVTTLTILGALTKADSLATGSSAWGSWKEQLVFELVRRTKEVLEGSPKATAAPSLIVGHEDLVAHVSDSREPVLVLDPPRVVVAAVDRPGLFADVAGTLAVHGLGVQSADAESLDGVALEVFAVEVENDNWPNEEQLGADLADVLARRVDLEMLLERRAQTYASVRKTLSAHPIVPSVVLDNEASAASSILEVHAVDEIGLLHALTSTLFRLDLDLVAARVQTIGGEVVDSFYLRDPSGSKITDAEAIESLKASVLSVISRRSDGEPIP